MNDVGASSKLKKSRKGTAASILSGVTDGGRGNVGSSRGRSIRLPTFIDYNSSSAASTAATTTNGYSYLDSEDDKHLKYRHRLKKRVIKYANSDSTGALGTLLRSAIRAGILERSFWKRTVVVALLLVTGLVSVTLFKVQRVDSRFRNIADSLTPFLLLVASSTPPLKPAHAILGPLCPY